MWNKRIYVYFEVVFAILIQVLQLSHCLALVIHDSSTISENGNFGLLSSLFTHIKSYVLLCLTCFFGLVKYPYTKQFTWSPHGDPPSPVLVIRYSKYWYFNKYFLQFIAMFLFIYIINDIFTTMKTQSHSRIKSTSM